MLCPLQHDVCTYCTLWPHCYANTPTFPNHLWIIAPTFSVFEKWFDLCIFECILNRKIHIKIGVRHDYMCYNWVEKLNDAKTCSTKWNLRLQLCFPAILKWTLCDVAPLLPLVIYCCLNRCSFIISKTTSDIFINEKSMNKHVMILVMKYN